MNKHLRKHIMTRSRFKNRFNKVPTSENKIAYKKQCNLCVNLSRKAKHEYYSTLNPSIVVDNRKFWSTIKPLFSDKVKLRNKITLIENENITSDDKEVAEKLNSFFIKAVSNLNIQGFDTSEFVNNKDNCHVINIKGKFKNHPSILKIRQNINISPNKFSFVTMDINDVEDKINNLHEKTTSIDDIPAKILKKCCNVVSPYITEIYKDSTQKKGFPNPLKKAIVTSVHKKEKGH